MIFWKSLIRNLMVNGFLLKKIEEYGVLKVTDKGRDFLKNPKSYMISIDKDFDNE